MDLMAVACLLDCVLFMKEIIVSPCLHTVQYSKIRLQCSCMEAFQKSLTLYFYLISYYVLNYIIQASIIFLIVHNLC